MRDVDLSFGGIEKNSLEFLTRLWRARILERESEHAAPKVSADVGSLRVSFKGFKGDDRMELADVATLALVIRQVAAAARPVHITYPAKFKSRHSRLHVYLESLGFHDLFAPDHARQPWQEHIAFEGYEAHGLAGSQRLDETRYVPLRWFTKDDFVFEPTVSIWETEHALSREFDERFRAVLRLQDYGDSDTIDLLCRTMLMELGWNTVIHSADRQSGDGVGIFGAQIIGGNPIDPRPETLTFCVADLGRGIPSTLRQAYEADKDRGKKMTPRNESELLNDILRYSLFRNSTSRPAFPSTWSKESLRGLARVTYSLEGRGTMVIRSEGAAIELTGAVDNTKDETKDTFKDCPYYGTQIVGALRPDQALIRRRDQQPSTVAVPPRSVVLVCNLFGQCPTVGTEEAAKLFAAALQAGTDPLVLDLGQGEDSPRSLEYLCKSIYPLQRSRWVIFWNVRSQWNELAALDAWIRSLGSEGFAVLPLFVRGHNDMRIFGGGGTKRPGLKVAALRSAQVVAKLIDDGRATNRPKEAMIGQPVMLAPKEYIEISQQVNGVYLAEGFRCVSALPPERQPNGTAGFYVGQIHLLGGQDIDSRYVSLGRNLQEGRQSNRLRWAVSATAGISCLLNEFPVDDSQLVLLAFTGTVRDVAVEVFQRLGRRCRAYVLLTFDVPTKHEIKSLVREGDRVVLLTDVISTGSLVDSVIDLVVRVGGSVIGVVSLVQRRESEKVGRGNFLAEKVSYPYIVGGMLPSEDLGTDPVQEELYVDPVSLIPSKDKAWGWAHGYDDKIERTLALIQDTNSALCGHIVDGARHSSVYIDLRRLLQAGRSSARRFAQTVFTERLHLRGWKDFAPAAILFPAGITRIEPIGWGAEPHLRDDKVTTYPTAVAAYTELLRQIWENGGRRISLVEVQRAFDPGGGARCSKTVQWPDLPEVFDVVIADDGLWRGTTANALIQLALQKGANRILVAPLLARLTPPEAEHLEALHAIDKAEVPDLSQSTDAVRAGAGICYAFPLLLPIPYYSAHECPYEATMMHLVAKEGRLTALARICRQLREKLQGINPATRRPSNPVYSDTWVRTRAYVEMATQHETALAKLTSIIQDTTDPEALLALFTLLVEEWQLLGRARLRQSVMPKLRARAVAVAVDPAADIALRIAAVTVLRSLFRREFVAQLVHLVDLALSHEEALGRLLFQVSSLGESWREAPECLRFLDAVGERGSVSMPTGANQALADRKRAAELIADARSLAIDLRASQMPHNRSHRQVAATLWDHLVNSGFAENHHMRAFFLILATKPPTFEKLDRDTVENFYRPWKSTFQERLIKNIFPEVRQISRLLVRTGNPDHGIFRSDLLFLRHDAEGLLGRIAGIGTWLDFLLECATSKDPNALRSDLAQYYWDNLLFNADKIYTELIAEKSKTVALLAEMKSSTVGDLANRFTREIKAHFAAAKRAVTIEPVEGLETIQPSAVVFAANGVIEDCIANVVHNLLRYAFPADNAVISPTINIRIQPAEAGAESKIQLFVRNNGAKLKPGAVAGDGGRRVNADLELFGGTYHLPEALEGRDWRVMQRLTFSLW